MGNGSTGLRIRGVVFDLDNTLYDRDRAFRMWARAFIAEEFAHLNGGAQGAVLEQFVRIDARGYTRKAELFTQVSALYPTLPHPVDELCARFYKEWLQYMALDPETEALLDHLAASQIPFGIITNGPLQQQDKILQMKLDQRTEHIFISELFGCAKPDPRIFHAAAERLGVAPAEILFVGDSPTNDVAGAAGVGMQTVWICGTDAWPEHLTSVSPDHVCTTVGGVMGVLRTLAP